MWLVGVVIRRWVWLECLDVVSGWCCKELHSFPHITYPYSTCISSFCSIIPTYFFVHLKNVFNPRHPCTARATIVDRSVCVCVIAYPGIHTMRCQMMGTYCISRVWPSF